jgi:hypothetical protein
LFDVLMNIILLFLWTGSCLFLPGYLVSRWLSDPSDEQSITETLALSMLFGAGWLIFLGVGLCWLDRFSLPWVVGSTVVFVALLGYATKPRSRVIWEKRENGWLFWVCLAALSMGLVFALAPYRQNAFGVDSYYWIEAAVRIAESSPRAVEGAFFEDYPVLYSNPAGYAYLMATAAALGPTLHAGESIIFISLLWTVLSFVAAFAFVNYLAGPRWGTFGGITYIGSYWALYYLICAAVRQGLGFAVAPLYFLLLARRGVLVLRDLRFYIFVGVIWQVHPLTGFILMTTLPVILVFELVRQGPRRLARALGVRGVAGAVLLGAAPTWVLLRFFPSLVGLFHISDDPFKYQMDPMNLMMLIKTVGPVTLCLLAFGWLGLLGNDRRPNTAVRVGSCTLFVMLIAIGVFPQDWYKSSFSALAPHRYYIFYSIVAVCWLAAAGPKLERFCRRWPVTSRQWGMFLVVLAFGQLGFDTFFALRNNEVRPSVQTVLNASRWVVEKTGKQEKVTLVLQDREMTVPTARAVLAPRKVLDVVVETPAGAFERAAAQEVGGIVTDFLVPPCCSYREVARFEIGEDQAFVFMTEKALRR